MREVPFFGEFYRRTTAPFLSRGVTRAEALFIRSSLEGCTSLLDLGCGEGRHLEVLRAEAPEAALLGVDLDVGSLEAARDCAPVARSDLRCLPFATGALDGCFCWYSTLFVFDEVGNRCALAEAARVLRPGGRLLLQTVNPATLASQPEASFERLLPDGTMLRERSIFDPATGIDRGERTLIAPGAEPTFARYTLRYYSPDELQRLLQAVGLRPLRLFGSALGEDFGPTSPELIVLAEREDG